MIWWMMLIFFVLSPIYAWGIIKLFGTNFRWSLAASLGIACVVSGAYVAGLIPLSGLMYLAGIFYAAYPGMLGHDMYYRKMLKEERQAELDKVLCALEAVLEASDNPNIPEINIDTTKVKNWQAVYDARRIIDQYKDVAEWKSERFFTQ